MNWNKKYKNCISCGTIEWSHKSKGYCQKCYPLIKDIEKVKNWNKKMPQTLCSIRGINPIKFLSEKRINPFNVIKTKIVEQLQSKLELYKLYNNPKNADGLDIENVLKEIAGYCRIDSHIYEGAATKYLDNFNAKQRIIIFKDMLNILVNKNIVLNTTQILFPEIKLI